MYFSFVFLVNPKRLENGLNVIQLETAVGSAIHNFEGSIGEDFCARWNSPPPFCLDEISFRRDYKSCRIGVVRSFVRSFIRCSMCHIYGNFAMG